VPWLLCYAPSKGLQNKVEGLLQLRGSRPHSLQLQEGENLQRKTEKVSTELQSIVSDSICDSSIVVDVMGGPNVHCICSLAPYRASQYKQWVESGSHIIAVLTQTYIAYVRVHNIYAVCGFRFKTFYRAVNNTRSRYVESTVELPREES
jgi:hypothetical protein